MVVGIFCARINKPNALRKLLLGGVVFLVVRIADYAAVVQVRPGRPMFREFILIQEVIDGHAVNAGSIFIRNLAVSAALKKTYLEVWLILRMLGVRAGVFAAPNFQCRLRGSILENVSSAI